MRTEFGSQGLTELENHSWYASCQEFFLKMTFHLKMFFQASLVLAGLRVLKWRTVCFVKLSLENCSWPVPSPEITDSCAQVASLCRGLGSAHYRCSSVLAFLYRVKIMLYRSFLKTETWGYLEATKKVQQTRSLRWNWKKLNSTGKKSTEPLLLSGKGDHGREGASCICTGGRKSETPLSGQWVAELLNTLFY